MRIDIHSVHVELTPALRRYAESRVWLAAGRHVPRVTWVGVWLIGESPGGDARPRPVACRIDAWLRGAGHTTVHHTDGNAHAAIDVAAARLGQAIPRTVRHAVKRRRRRLLAAAGGPHGDGPAGDGRSPSIPRLAAVIERRDARRRRLPLLPWLRARYGIELVSRHRLPRHEWDAAADPATDARDALSDRLAPALARRPDLVVVVGHPRHDIADGRDHVRRIVRRIRPLVAPAPAKGIWAEECVWLNERWEPECHVESQELDCAHADGDANERPGRGMPVSEWPGLARPSRAGDVRDPAVVAGAFLDFDPILPDRRSGTWTETVAGTHQREGGGPWSSPPIV
jgi:ribosome-associated translation inhibitor RaiA